MEVVVSPAGLDEKPVIARLLQLYHYDFTEFLPLKLGANGEYAYRYLDVYWDPEPGEQRYPFLVRADGELAGFALVRFINDTYLMSEFFVLRPYRQHGVGREAALAVFRKFPGKWIIHQVSRNLPAQSFWRRIIAEYTDENYDDSTDERGVTQKFISRE